jgi:hypothetical protein
MERVVHSLDLDVVLDVAAWHATLLEAVDQLGRARIPALRIVPCPRCAERNGVVRKNGAVAACISLMSSAVRLKPERVPNGLAARAGVTATTSSKPDTSDHRSDGRSVGATDTTMVLGGMLVMMVLLFPRGLAPALIKGITQILRLCSPTGAGG